MFPPRRRHTRIWRIGKLLADDRRRTLARLGIDAATLDLLSTLRRAGPPYRLTAGALAELSLVSAGAISQRVARAEREGLVRRGRSDADGRLSYVTLTAAGHALIERSVDGLLRHEEALLAALTASSAANCAAHLKVLLASLSPHPGLLSRTNWPSAPVYPPRPSCGSLLALTTLRPGGRGFRGSRPGVPVSRPTAPGRTRSV